MASQSGFWDRIARRYSQRPVADEAAYRKKLALTQDLLAPDMSVLEFGCGTGSTALEHASHVSHIKAVDISANMLEIARTRAATADVSNVTFEQSGMADLVEGDASYDVVMGHSILHLLDDRPGAMAKTWKMLKPGGLFISSTPCLGGWIRLLKGVFYIGQRLGKIPPLWFFSEQELVQEMEAAGFHIEQQWQPGKGKALFVVARKPEAESP
jgi:ubiquinone/menaquinone biosynthesis C-methylase UbiE